MQPTASARKSNQPITKMDGQKRGKNRASMSLMECEEEKVEP